MLRSLRVLLHKEFLQIRRDNVILRMLFILPILQLVVLANAATFEVRTANLWVVDQDHTPVARALADRFLASGRFVVVGTSAITRPADDALLAGRADAVLVIPQDFASDLGATRHSVVQLILNAVNGAQAGLIQSYASEITSSFAASMGAARAPVKVRRTMEVRTRSLYNPSLDYKRFMIPGILVQLMTLVGTLMTALNIVREKEAGTLDQLNVTPIRPSVFIAAKLIPMWVIGVIEFAMGMVIARLVFNVPMVGNPIVVLGGLSLFLLAALGLGLWISTMVDTQQQAVFVTFSVLMIYLLMSGLFTPVRSMPHWAQMVAQANPLMHFIVVVRAVMLKGSGFSDVWRQMVALAVIGATLLSLAVKQYQKRSA
jgi:ABC-2 type transport system permease protein